MRMAKENKNLIVALDIGTSKVACLVAEVRPDGALEILGMGNHESKGLKKGVVVNIEATVSAVQRALEEAELMADCKIASAFVGIAGSHIKSFNSTGMVAIKDREVSGPDVERAIDTARAVSIPTDQQILHVLRQEFIIDGQEDVREPIGMSGVRLEVKVHIVTGAVSAAQNIVKCVRRCGLEVNDLILQPLASSRAVLSPTSRCSRTARSVTPRSSRSPATRSRMTSRWRSGRRPPRRKASRSGTAWRCGSLPTRTR